MSKRQLPFVSDHVSNPAGHIGDIIERALVDEAMDHVFQPVWELATRRLVGFEALARFPGPYAPDRVFHQAKGMGVGRTFDLLSFRTALYQARVLPGLLFVNVDPDHLMPNRSAGAGASVSVVTRYRQRDCLVVEVTETPEHDRERTTMGLERIRRLGIRIALDDAGTRSSNRERLGWLQPSYVKIDRSLIVQARGGHDRGLRRWVDLAHQTGALLVAEGVEDPLWAEWLQDLGIEWVQGFGFGMPRPADEWAQDLLKQADAQHLRLSLRYFSPPAFDHLAPPVPPMTTREVGDLLFEDLPFPVCVLDDKGVIAGVNRQAEHYWGVQLSTIVGQPFESGLGIRRITPEVPAIRASDPAAAPVYAHRVQRADGTEFTANLLIYQVEKRSRPYTVMIVTGSSRISDSLGRFDTDPLTGLPSRMWWEQAQVLWDKAGSVVFMDLDGLKTANDLFGHAEGDRFLKIAGRTVRQWLPGNAVAVRYGGDEILVVWPGARESVVADWAERVNEELESQLPDARIPLRFSYGTATFESGELIQAIQTADTRLLEKKGLMLPTDRGAYLMLTTAGRRGLWSASVGGEDSIGSGEEYDQLIQAIYPDAAKEAQDFAKWVKPNPGLAVVEVAAGTARLAENGLAAMLGPGSQYLITDASDLLLARAFRKCRRQWPWVHCLMAPMDDLPLASQCVDLVIAAFLFAPPKPGQVLKEMGRVVRPGGHIAISFRLRRELPDAWERVLRYVAPTEAVHRRQGEDLEQWQEQGEKMGLVVDGVRSDGGTFRFPSHEWAWAFLVGSGYWARVLRPHLASQGEMAIQRSANTVREALADIPLDQLTIPWALHYLRWTRPA